MKSTTFNVDSKTDEVLEELKEKLGATSKAEVLRKSIAFLKAATERQEDDGTVVIKGKALGSDSGGKPGASEEVTIRLK